MSNIGVTNFSYALLTQDDTTGVKYGEWKKIPGINKIEVKPNASSATNYGDDIALETATTLGEIDLTIDMVDLPAEDIAALLGHKIGDTGEMIYAGEDTAPYVAVMFRGTKSDGTGRWVKVLKTKFQELTDTYQTKEDKVTFQNPQLTGKAVARKYDTEWKRTMDETTDNADKVKAFTASVETAAASSSTSA